MCFFYDLCMRGHKEHTLPPAVKLQQYMCMFLFWEAHYMGLPWGSVGKESASSAGNLGSVPGSLSNRNDSIFVN